MTNSQIVHCWNYKSKEISIICHSALPVTIGKLTKNKKKSVGLIYVEVEDSLTSWASVLTSGEWNSFVGFNTVIVIWVQLPLIVWSKDWSRSKSTDVRIIISRTESRVAVSRGVVPSSISQCSYRTDKLGPGEA